MSKRAHRLTYTDWQNTAEDIELPAVFVDLASFDENVTRLTKIAADHNKTLRMATKSIRVPALVKRAYELAPQTMQGLMCFSVPEAVFWSEQGFRDLLVAYPTVEKRHLLSALTILQSGKKLSLMVDHVDHLKSLVQTHQSAGASLPFEVCIDCDLSYRKLGQHLGVQRSSIRTLDDFVDIFKFIKNHQTELKLVGVMGYEAQIAGVADQNPFHRSLNPAKQLLKKISTPDVAKRRREINLFLESENYQLNFFNGGGTGSIKSTSQEPWISEVTAGSGFLQSHLFDYYAENENQPAIFFALPVTRQPQEGVLTCKSGGFISSGEASIDKSPIVHLPQNLKPISTEGFGEVQTPFRGADAASLKLGDPVICRPAKAGEIAERFNHYYLIEQDGSLQLEQTYRGSNLNFF